MLNKIEGIYSWLEISSNEMKAITGRGEKEPMEIAQKSIYKSDEKVIYLKKKERFSIQLV